MGIGEVGEKLRRSTVQVRGVQVGGGSGRGEIGSSGSGVIWDASGAIVTNAHVVATRELTVELTVELWDGRRAQARLDRRDARRDLAILRMTNGSIAASELEPASPGDSSRIRVGQFVIAVGNPLGFTGALSTGVIHGITGAGRRQFIQTTARLAPGNSGGPLADARGNVIGINTMVVHGGLGLAIPSDAVRRLLTMGPRSELGVILRAVGIEGPAPGIGLLVLGIAPGSAAEYASLRIGDVLLGTSGTPFTSVDDFLESLDGTEPITLQFLRGGERKRREVTVRLIQSVAA